MKLKFLSLVLFLICHQICAWEFIGKNNQLFLYAPLQQHEFYHVQRLFIEGFTRNYEALEDKQLRKFLSDSLPADMAKEICHIQNDTSMHQIAVKNNNGEVIGFIAFHETDVPGQVYIRQLCIHPRYWNKGIGKELMSSVVRILPYTKHIVLVTERINKNAQAFYAHLGFIECNYVHEGYEPEYYLGLEIYL